VPGVIRNQKEKTNKKQERLKKGGKKKWGRKERKNKENMRTIEEKCQEGRKQWSMERKG
jgi:hypothetical protein